MYLAVPKQCIPCTSVHIKLYFFPSNFGFHAFFRFSEKMNAPPTFESFLLFDGEKKITKEQDTKVWILLLLCLGSGSATFWLPESGSGTYKYAPSTHILGVSKYILDSQWLIEKEYIKEMFWNSSNSFLCRLIEKVDACSLIKYFRIFFYSENGLVALN